MAFPLSPFMQAALDEARAAADDGEVPVGAVVTLGGAIISIGRNVMRSARDPTAHAEIVAIRRACSQLGSERLIDCELWVTLEPCAMCAGAISEARIRRLVYAAPDAKGGGIEHGARVFATPTCRHRPEIVAGIGAAPAAALLRQFFRERR